MTKASYNPGTPMFLQDGHNPHIMLCFFFFVFFQMWTDPDPLTVSLTCIGLWFLERYKVHIVKLCHKVFYARHVCVFKDKNKEALFNVAYLKRQHKLCRAFYCDITISFNRYLPVLLYFPSTTPLYASVSKGAASTICYTFGMVWPGFEPTTSRSESGRSTN